MENKFSVFLVLRLLFQPTAVFKVLASLQPSTASVFFKIALWFGILPPLFAYFGANDYGWRMGAVEPIFLTENTLLIISAAYFLALLTGFVSTSLISQWMAETYGARSALGIHFAMISIVGAPIALGSVIHLYPDIFINLLVLVPAMLWSMYLLYRGLPVVLHTTPERGMLMASSLIGYFLVALVGLLGITVVLWSYGLGPAMGV